MSSTARKTIWVKEQNIHQDVSINQWVPFFQSVRNTSPQLVVPGLFSIVRRTISQASFMYFQVNQNMFHDISFQHQRVRVLLVQEDAR